MEPTPRFDLEQAVASWRKELARQPGPAAKDVRELEVHLQDIFNELKKKELSDEEAFLVARHRVGPPVAVAAEYAKRKLPPMWRTRLFWYSFLLVFAGFIGWMFSRPAEFIAVASVRMQKDPKEDPENPVEFNTRIRIAETRDVAIRVAALMTPEQRAAFVAPFPKNQASNPNANLVNQLLTQRFVVPGRLAYIIQVGIEHTDPVLAAVVANDFAQAFMDQERVRDPAQQYQWLDKANGHVQQTEPKFILVLLGGFFLGLVSAVFLSMVVRLISWVRRPPTPPAEMA